jgi:hypothetical protein
MNVKGFLLSAVLATLTVGCAAQLSAQEVVEWGPFRDVHLRNDCRLAFQVLTKGEPANHSAWALGVIPRCGPVAGRAVVWRLQNLTSGPGTADLVALDRLIGTVWGLRDAELFNGALAVARDPAQSDRARVQALRVLFGVMRPETYLSYDALWTRSGDEVTTMDQEVRGGLPLPANYLEQTLAVTEAITPDSGAAPQVIAAAEYVGGVARALLRNSAH